MVDFRCKSNGTIISFTNESDIAGTRKHEGYEEIKDVKATETLEAESAVQAEEKMMKFRGRPPKVR